MMYVAAAGVTSCVGSSADAACAAMRCRVPGFSELPYLDIRGRPLVGAPVAHVVSHQKGKTRLADLAAPAVAECLAAREADSVVPVTVAIACPKPGIDDGTFGPGFLSELENRLNVAFTPRSRTFTGGATAAISALQYASALLEGGSDSICVVAGVDSLLSEPELRRLERARIIKQQGSNPTGMIPGEGACALLCLHARSQGDPCISVSGLDRMPESAVRGSALVAALRTALSVSTLRPNAISAVLTDLSGERELSLEFTIALTRVFTEPQEALHKWHLAMSVGSIGAASVPTQLAWWLAAARRGYAPGANAACLALSEPGWRGVAVSTTHL
jgi:3-oxoacyl-[acyl-carrier-protein] synthase I